MVFMFEKNLRKDVTDRVEWRINIDTLFKNFDCIPYFDETLRYHGPCYHLVGEKSKHYRFE